MKKTFFQVSQVLSFRLEKQTSENVADTTFNDHDMLLARSLPPYQREYYMNGSIKFGFTDFYCKNNKTYFHKEINEKL